MKIFKLLLFVLSVNVIQSIVCPSSFNHILDACYKVNNRTRTTWLDAKNYCAQQISQLGIDQKEATIHLLALESAIETSYLLSWLQIWYIETQFWTDGIVSPSLWSWSNQSITWYFNQSEQAVDGNGTHYRLIYNTNKSTYQISDDVGGDLSNFICEYQEFCKKNHSCHNGGTCFVNVGGDLCLCAAGFTGPMCEEEIDDCLSSPCLHGGICVDHLNHYTCDCSQIYFHGPNCENEMDEPTKRKRSIAFWLFFSSASLLLALLILYDLRLEDFAEFMGWSCSTATCFKKHGNNTGEILNNQDSNTVELPVRTDDSNLFTVTTINQGKLSLDVINTIWNPEKIRNQMESNMQADDPNLPDHSNMTDDVLIQTYAATVIENRRKQRKKYKRIQKQSTDRHKKRKEPAKNTIETIVTWKEELQKRIKSASTPETSSSATKQLNQQTNTSDS